MTEHADLGGRRLKGSTITRCGEVVLGPANQLGDRRLRRQERRKQQTACSQQPHRPVEHRIVAHLVLLFCASEIENQAKRNSFERNPFEMDQANRNPFPIPTDS